VASVSREAEGKIKTTDASRTPCTVSKKGYSKIKKYKKQPSIAPPVLNEDIRNNKTSQIP
jgi:hypothetical protein